MRWATVLVGSAGTIFVHIDGRTAADAAAGIHYPDNLLPVRRQHGTRWLVERTISPAALGTFTCRSSPGTLLRFENSAPVGGKQAPFPSITRRDLGGRRRPTVSADGKFICTDPGSASCNQDGMPSPVPDEPPHRSRSGVRLRTRQACQAPLPCTDMFISQASVAAVNLMKKD
jgi:hypothetical protein